MKKILALLLAIMLVLSFAACSKNDDEPQTDANGNTIEQQDDNNSTSAGAQNDGKDNSNNGTSANSDGNTSANSNGTTKAGDSSGTTKAGDKGTTAKNELDIGSALEKSDIPKDAYLANYVKEIVTADEYTCSVSSIQDEQNIEATIAKSGEKYSLEGVIDKMNVKMINKDGLTYLCVPYEAFNMLTGSESELSSEEIQVFKTLFGDAKSGSGIYMTVSNEESGMGSFSDLSEMFTALGDESITYVGLEKVTKDGVKYNCEEYKSGDDTIKYYFEGEELRLIESIDADGESSFIKVKDLKAGVEDGAFDVPKGYTDITKKLEALEGMYQ